MPQWKNTGTGEVRESGTKHGTMNGGMPSQPGIYNSGMDVANLGAGTKLPADKQHYYSEVRPKAQCADEPK